MLTEPYHREYQSLLRLAMLLLYDLPAAEEVVQEALIAMHKACSQPSDPDRAVARLRREVVSRSRSAKRRCPAAARQAPQQVTGVPSVKSPAMEPLERSPLTAALRGMPIRQREAIVLRYYAGLSEAETATTMGISRGAVKAHTARGVAALRPVMEQSAS